MGQPRDDLDGNDGDLSGGQDGEDLAGDVHAQQARDGDDRPGGQRPRPPGRAQVQVRLGLALGRGAERPVQADLQEGVGQQRHQGGSDAQWLAQAAGDEGGERPGVGDVPGHRHVAGHEQRQDHRDRHERERDAGQPGRRVRRT